MSTGLWHRLMIFERLLLASLLLTLTSGLIYTDWLWRWDQTLYDAYIKLSPHSPAEDIVIVAIDAESLQQQGSWPWSRHVHTRLVERLTEAGARAIVFDIIFTETSNPKEDQLFAQAITDSGRVVLPLLVEQARLASTLVESLPIPELASAAAALGHVHFELDQDGIARSLYLMGGLGTPQWPSLSLAALRFLEPSRWQQLPGTRPLTFLPDSPYVWVQDHRVMIPFAGPPGSYPIISYADALKTRHFSELFRDKIVLIGSIVTGLSDTLPTPVSGLGQPMAGVEIHANVIDSLRRGSMINPLPVMVRFLLSMFVVLLPVFIFPLIAPRYALLTSVLLILGSIALSFGLFRFFHLWFAPLPLLVGLSISYPLWSWRRLEYTLRYLNNQLDTLQQETSALAVTQPVSLAVAMTCVQQRLPVAGWILMDGNEQVIDQAGEVQGKCSALVEVNRWQYHQGVVWTALSREGELLKLGLSWCSEVAPDRQQYSMLTELTRPLHKQIPNNIRTAAEFVQSRVEQLQQATAQLNGMRDLMANSLAEMADGVLIVDVFGIVLLANRQAASYLPINSQSNLVGKNIEMLMTQLKGVDVDAWRQAWRQALTQVLLQSTRETLYAGNDRGDDFVIQIARLSIDHENRSGVIVNLTDISALKASERKRTELLGFLSHDLRSPMVSILSLIELRREQLGKSKEQQQFLEHVTDYTQQVLILSEGFLYLAKADSLEEAEFRSVDLVDVAYNALQQVWPQAMKKKIRVVQRFEVDEVFLLGNAQLLERVIVNLLTNAVKYSPDQGEIELSLEKKDGVIKCRVKDSGYGISAEFLPNVFDRFSREKSEAGMKQGGSGLGLAFVKQTVEKHGGRVEVQSTEGVGSCFCLIFPV